MARRLSVRAARVTALGALTVGLALVLAPAAAVAAVTASGVPSQSPTSIATEEVTPELATFGLTSASGGAIDNRSFLALTAPPGSVIYDSVAVVNQSNAPIDLALYSADAQNAADGAIGLPDRTVTPSDAGAWITVGASTVTVPPQSSSGIGYTVVPITITVPADAEPGDHVAGVVTSLTAAGNAAGGDQSATINLEQRVGLRVYITVDGPIRAGLAITDVHAVYHQADAFGLAGAGSATVTYRLTNSGNTRLTVQPTIVASGLFGQVETGARGDLIDELLPKASVMQTVEFTRLWPVFLDRVSVSAMVSAPVSGT